MTHLRACMNRGDIVCSAGTIPEPAHWVIAGCNSLVLVDRHTVGDPMEKAALEHVNWVISQRAYAVVVLSRSPLWKSDAIAAQPTCSTVALRRRARSRRFVCCRAMPSNRGCSA